MNDGELAKEDTFEYKGVLVDIFYFYRSDDELAYCCDFVNRHGCSSRAKSIKEYGSLLPRKIYLPLGKGLTTILFKGIEVSIPINYKEILSFRYGDDFMTPKPGWRPKTEYIKEVPEWNGFFEDF